MNCMKCGKEIAPDQVFCEECLADMEKYPVKQGGPVRLPPRATVPVQKRSPSHRKPRNPENQIARLRRLVAVLSVFTLTLLILFLLAMGLVFYLWQGYLPFGLTLEALGL